MFFCFNFNNCRRLSIPAHTSSSTVICRIPAMFMKAAALVACSSVVAAADPFHFEVQNGNFTIKDVTMHSPATNDTWKERAVAVITMTGTSEKLVDAGTLQFQVYEHGVRSFIASGSFACASVGWLDEWMD